MEKVLASEFGFSTVNDGKTNREILQRMLDIGGHVMIDKPGTYDICGTV